jgi:hypothetical protein
MFCKSFDHRIRKRVIALSAAAAPLDPRPAFCMEPTLDRIGDLLPYPMAHGYGWIS